MSLEPVSHSFKFCPKCGSTNCSLHEPNRLECADCCFIYYFNASTAVGAIISNADGRVLLIRRDIDPGKGKLGLPGGFVDIGETVEEGLEREVWEEVGLKVISMRYFCSFPNPYEAQGVIYPLLDIYFVCEVESVDTAVARDEVSEVLFVEPQDIEFDEIAFPSVRAALEMYVSEMGS